jgi:hypothetical protein
MRQVDNIRRHRPQHEEGKASLAAGFCHVLGTVLPVWWRRLWPVLRPPVMRGALSPTTFDPALLIGRQQPLFGLAVIVQPHTVAHEKV